jgi:pSer/pThr/pTyr-binding forkhead associated (FHA) protein
MNLRLQIRWTEPPGESADPPGLLEFTLDRDQDCLWIGRGADAHVRLPHPMVSQKHARVVLRKEAAWLEESGSTNGTQLNGKTVVAGRPHQLAPGDMVSVGPFRISILDPSGGETTEKTSTECLARGLVRDWLAESADALPYVMVRTGPGKGARMEIPLGKPLILGRDPGCNLTLDDADISRQHARIYCDLDGSWLNDMKSKNGVWVGERKISRPCKLASGQVFTLGNTQVEYTDPAELYLESLEQMADRILENDRQPQPMETTPQAGHDTSDQTRAPDPNADIARALDPDTDIISGGPVVADVGDDHDAQEAHPPESRAGFWILVAVGTVAAIAAVVALTAVLMGT